MDEKLIALFWSKVEKRGPDDCWDWQAARNPRGYGVGWDGQKTRLAHRIAWFLTRGTWPSDCLCHQCDNPACCNPAHLWEGSRADNLADMRAKGRGFLPPRPNTRGETHAVAKLTEVQATEILRRGYRGEAHTRLAAEFGISLSNIGAIIDGRSWSHLPRPHNDQRKSKVKLSAELVREIRARSASGESASRLARSFGISRATIYSVVTRTTWAHVA